MMVIVEENLQNNIMLSFYRWECDINLKRKKTGQEVLDRRGALIQSPYKKGSTEDINFRIQKTKEMEEKGIHHISFVYKDEMKKKVSRDNVRN